MNLFRSSPDFSPDFTFKRLHAHITEEDGAFTVNIRMRNHLKPDERAWEQEIAATIDMASSMIGCEWPPNWYGQSLPCRNWVNRVGTRPRRTSFHVRFTPNSTRLLRGSEMTRRAIRRHSDGASYSGLCPNA
jgi:hypothetical protein